MKKVFLYCFFFSFIIIIQSCREKKFTFKDLSSFTIDTTALKETEIVRTIYFSGGPDYNNGFKYYYRYIVVSELTGDTVNVLSAVVTHFDENNPMKRFIPNSNSSIITIDKLIELAQRNKNTGQTKPEEINKVVSNRTFKSREENSYPYIIGLFSEFNTGD